MVKMSVYLMNETEDIENAEQKIAKAAKLCYSDATIPELFEKVEKQDIEAFIKNIIAIGHHSVLEHVTFTFAVEGISRVLTHQLVRHRLANYSQQSQRYVKLDKTFEVITPESIANINVDTPLAAKYDALMKDIHDLYNEYLDIGVPAEDARYVLPNATETKVVVTMNVRVLLHVFNVRCCNRAQWEIRAMTIEMLRQLKRVIPLLFEGSGPACVAGSCREGKMSCGKHVEVREKFKTL